MSDENQSNVSNVSNVSKRVEIIEDDDDTKYDKLVKISLYISAWLLSCVLLYTYNSKRTANIEYNKLLTKVNTNKLNDQIKKYQSKCKNYIELAYPINSMSDIDEVDPSGVTRAKRELYVELIKTMEIYEKCNYIKMNTNGSPFPVSEIMISCLILLIIIGFIAVSNFTNNPFKKLTIDTEVNEIKQMIIDSTQGLTEKAEELDRKEKKNEETESSGGIDNNEKVVTGGSGPQATQTSMVLLDELNRKDMEISTRINFLKSDATFNYVSLSFTVLIFSFYISFKMVMSSLRFKENLYSGSMFMKSSCYDM
jgi:hypothetical protein